ncbi:MAG: GIY-YIG nuclease family protein [Patescibacteria group bacterium]|nr:GIY-YIG nuclease family protein [Patescibacteria group bacterium]
MAYYVYIMTNKWHTVLYTGMTGRGEQRVQEHRDRVIPSFTARYHLNKVVFAEAFSTPIEAAAAEWKIKGWTRKKKIALIESLNPKWRDLLDGDASLRSAIQSENPKCC